LSGQAKIVMCVSLFSGALKVLKNKGNIDFLKDYLEGEKQ
jgi:hypothetical protein